MLVGTDQCFVRAPLLFVTMLIYSAHKQSISAFRRRYLICSVQGRAFKINSKIGNLQEGWPCCETQIQIAEFLQLQ